MRVAHLDCVGGVAGDMWLGALVAAGLPIEALRADVRALGCPGLDVAAESVRRGALAATLVRVTVDGKPADHHAAPQKTPEAMGAIVARATALPARVRERAQAVIRRLGEAEGTVHAAHHVHFHEVGAWDTLADCVGVAAGLARLGIERVTCSAVPTGRGTVQTSHGPMPIPAPATLELLRGVPLLDPPVEAELTTPTGAALVTTLCEAFGERPPLTVDAIGYGAGTGEPRGVANVLRMTVGAPAEAAAEGLLVDPVWVLEATLDDMTGQAVGHLADACRAAGALDVTVTPVQMKKNRPGVVLQALAHEDAVAAVEDALFRESTTFGVRRWRADRHVLAREIVTVPTPYGPIRVKLGRRAEAVIRVAPEHDDCVAAAAAAAVPLAVVVDAARAAARPAQGGDAG